MQDVKTGKEFTIWKEDLGLNEDYENNYNFGKFTFRLNHLTEEMIESNLLPPTDSRFRSDVRNMEHGNFKLAQKHKTKIEKDRAYCNECPRFFKKVSGDPNLNQEIKYELITGDKGYWNLRENGNWGEFIDMDKLVMENNTE